MYQNWVEVGGVQKAMTDGVDLLGADTHETPQQMNKLRQKERHTGSGDHESPGRVWEPTVVGTIGSSASGEVAGAGLQRACAKEIQT